MIKPLQIELTHFNTLRDSQTRWAEIHHLKETILAAIVPDTHGSIIDVVYTLPEFPQTTVFVKADLDNNEVKVAFEHANSAMMPVVLRYRQDEVRVEVLRKTIELLNGSVS